MWDMLEHQQADLLKTWAAAARAYKVAAGKLPRVTPRYSERISQLAKNIQVDVDLTGNFVMEASRCNCFLCSSCICIIWGQQQ